MKKENDNGNPKNGGVGPTGPGDALSEIFGFELMSVGIVQKPRGFLECVVLLDGVYS